MSWQSEPLSALTLKIGSGSTPRGGDSVYISEGTSLIRSQNVYNNEFSTDGLVYIDEKTAEKMKGVSVEKEDVLINITGDSVARCCLVNDEVLPARVNQHVAILRTNPKKLLPHFLAFYMVSPFMQAKLLSWAGTGGTRKALTKGMLEGFEIPVPPIDDQDKIVEKIKTYNDLIENNRRRIQLLEESARLLYQEWFVYLRFPGHEQVKITDGVPEGWEMKPISSLGRVITGKTPSTKNAAYYGDDVPFIKTPDMHGNVFVVSTSQSLSESGSKSQQSTLLPSGCIMVSCIGTVGVVSINPVEAHTNQQINSVIPENKHFLEFLFCGLKKIKPMLEAIGASSTMNNVNKSKFSSIEILVPSERLIAEFHFAVASTFELILSLQKQNLALAKARDLLLPKLMSGELTV
jgi:type I restriction enzyme S subunit